MSLVATGGFLGEGRVRPSLPYVLLSLSGLDWPDHGGALLGALNWATGETVAIKEIQLSNIPKSEIGQIMVRAIRVCPSLQLTADASDSPRSIC